MLLKKPLDKLLHRLRGLYTTQELIAHGMVVGKNFYRGEGVSFDLSHCWLIHIGDNVTIVSRSIILAHDAAAHHQTGYTRIGPVIIGNNVFLGAGSIVLPGVSIGDNVIVGAGSVVSRDIPANCVAIGAPAKPIKTYQEFIERCNEEIANGPCYGEDYTLRSKELTAEKKRQMFEELSRTKRGYVI